MHFLLLLAPESAPICRSQQNDTQTWQPLEKDMDMAAFDTSRTSYGSQSFTGRINAFIANVIASVVAWNDARVTRNALASLSDRELEDIGLVRGDIEYVATVNRNN